MSIKEHPPQHVPVLLEASLDVLQPARGDRYLDLTAGYGGHAEAFLAQTESYDTAVLVDRDEFAISTLKRFADRGTRLLNTDFASAAQDLVEAGETFDLILVDLGVSSPQLDNASRGFSFQTDAPLDMRMDQRQAVSAADYLRRVSERDLADVLHRYGEEPIGAARRYAHAIVTKRPRTTEELADAVLSAHHGRWQHTHPATRTFQAIRIAINDELGQIEQMLTTLPALLKPGGRVGIISFHSLEDRLVKQYLQEQTRAGYEAELALLTKKPRDGTEDVHNPRARSAKLRAAVKI